MVPADLVDEPGKRWNGICIGPVPLREKGLAQSHNQFSILWEVVVLTRKEVPDLQQPAHLRSRRAFFDYILVVPLSV